jgi:hypothetical protein
MALFLMIAISWNVKLYSPVKFTDVSEDFTTFIFSVEE